MRMETTGFEGGYTHDGRSGLGSAGMENARSPRPGGRCVKYVLRNEGSRHEIRASRCAMVRG
jgi:hypothetical protein